MEYLQLRRRQFLVLTGGIFLDGCGGSGNAQISAPVNDRLDAPSTPASIPPAPPLPPSPAPPPLPSTASPLPDWVPSAGQLLAISLNRVADQNPIAAAIGAPDFVYGGAGKNHANVLGAWNSGVFNPWFGPLGALVVCGGGDADWWGNEVYVFPLADTATMANGVLPARRWKRINNPSTAMNGTNGAIDPQFNGAWGEHGDGTPAMPHTYDQLEILPPSAGGGKHGSLVLCTKYIAYRVGHYRTAHRIDLDKAVWSRASTGQTTMDTNNNDSPSWVWHPPLQRMYGFPSGASTSNHVNMHYLDFQLAAASGVGTYGFDSAAEGSFAVNLCTRYWGMRDVIVGVGSNGSGGLKVQIWDPRNPGPAVEPGVVGDTIPSLWAPALAYVPPLGTDGTSTQGGRFFVRSPAAGEEQNVYRLDPPTVDWKTKPWRLTRIVMTGATVSGNSPNGMWKRFDFAPQINCLVWASSTDTAVYAYNVGDAA